MNRKILIFSIVSMTVSNAMGVVLDLNTALQETYKSCVGIDDALHDMKVKAGINTAVTAVGLNTSVMLR